MDLTGFAAIRAVVLAVGAEPDSVLALTEPAVPLAGAVLLGELALGANHRLVQPTLLSLHYMIEVLWRQATTARVARKEQRPACLDSLWHAC